MGYINAEPIARDAKTRGIALVRTSRTSTFCDRPVRDPHQLKTSVRSLASLVSASVASGHVLKHDATLS